MPIIETRPEMATAANSEGVENDIQILLDAGADPSLLKLQGQEAPIELLAEFLKCLMSDEYNAARLLCQKVLDLEPSNETAKEFVETIGERIRLEIIIF
jgi:hypothetical protein